MKTSEVINKMKSGEIVKKSGFPYSGKTIKFYQDAINSFEIDTPQNVKRVLETKGKSSVTIQNYLNVLYFFLDQFGIKYEKVAHKVFDTSSHIPEADRIRSFIQSFVPRNNQEKWAFAYIVAETYTSARYLDIANWTKENIVQIGEKQYIRYSQSKTGKIVQVPIHPKLADQFSSGEYLLPRVPYTSLLRYMKDLFRNAGFTQKITRQKYIKGKMITETIEEWQIMTTHKFRAIAITSMLEKGLSEHEVKVFSGHSPKSNSFSRYVGYSQKHLDEKYDQFLR